MERCEPNSLSRIQRLITGSERTEINLTELQKTLDTQGLEIIDYQKENTLGRKKLAEQTRGELLCSTTRTTRVQ